MDFSFLLRHGPQAAVDRLPRRENKLDESLLRSAGVRGAADQPVRHRQGRHCRPSTGSGSAGPIVEIGFRGALVSWSGSMFEYLMPPLVMKEPQGGILNQTNNLVDHAADRTMAARKGMPWGISEAAYNAPRPRDELPVHEFRRARPRPEARAGATTSSSRPMPACWPPVRAARGGRQPCAARAHRRARRYGYYDAVDFTPTRVPEGTRLRRRAQLHGPPPGHVDRRHRQRRLRRAHARPLPLRPGDRGGRTAAAGKGAARHPGRRRSAPRPASAATVGERRAAPGHPA